MLLLTSADFFKKLNFLKKSFRNNYQSVKQFGSGSEPFDSMIVFLKDFLENLIFEASEQITTKA